MPTAETPHASSRPLAASIRLASAMPERWWMVAAATLGLGAGYGGISTIAVHVDPLGVEFGWAKAEISSAYFLLSIGAAVGGLAAGRLADRFDVGGIAALGAVMMGLTLAALSLQSTVFGFRAVYLMMGLAGFSFLYAPLLTTVSRWFRDGHGLALGIVTAGGALGQAIVPPIFQYLASGHGWRAACIALGTGYLFVLLPAMRILRNPPPDPGPAAGATAAEAGHWPLPPLVGVGLVGLAGLLCCGLMGVPSVHLVSLALVRGLDPASAAALMTVAMAAGCLARVGTGLVVDRIGSILSYALVSSLQTGAVLSMAFVDGKAPLFLAAVVYGLGFGGAMTALVCGVRDAVPKEHLGTAMAVVGLLAWIGMGAGGWQGGICFDLTGGYRTSFLVAALSGGGNLAVLAVLGLLVRSRARGPRG